VDACDTFGAGSNGALVNDVSASPRDPVDIFYDGGGQIGTTGPVAATRAGWALDPGTLLAGAVEAYPTGAGGAAYVLPWESIGLSSRTSSTPQRRSWLPLASKSSFGGRQCGDSVDFVITVGNDSPGTAFGPIVVTDVAPAAFDIGGITADGMECSALDQTVSAWSTEVSLLMRRPL